jgi:hypothetical protein
MSEKQKNSLASIPPSSTALKLTLPYDRPDLNLPGDVKEFLLRLFTECNSKISFQLRQFKTEVQHLEVFA